MSELFPGSLVKVQVEADLLANLALIKKWLKSNDSEINEFQKASGRFYWRDRFIQEFEIKARNLLFTTYFFSKENPQIQNEYASVNDISYIKPWYDSINRLNLTGYVLHDGLSEDFVKTYSTQNVQFIRCRLGKYSLNDERFILYYMILLRYRTQIDAAFFTDGNDVQVTKNPFDFISMRDADTLFVGRNNGNLLRQSCINRAVRIKKFQEDRKKIVERNFYNQSIYNAGIIGGRLHVLLYLLMAMSRYFHECNSARNHNMAVLNYTIFNYWLPNCNINRAKKLGDVVPIGLYPKLERIFFNRFTKHITERFYPRQKEQSSKFDYAGNTKYIVTSYPLCSAFKQYEQNSDAYFIHK